MHCSLRWLKILTMGFLAVGCCWVGGCRKHDLRTVEIRVPDMKDQESARIIQDAFIRHIGVKTVQPDISAGIVRVTYNSMQIARKNLEFIIANAGFAANDIPAKTNVAGRVSSPPSEH
ncbi:MAG: heavy-metal-associated domain-containing protein [Kiritimatiellia bacterium]|jgi:hypothetical protein